MPLWRLRNEKTGSNIALRALLFFPIPSPRPAQLSRPQTLLRASPRSFFPALRAWFALNRSHCAPALPILRLTQLIRLFAVCTHPPAKNSRFIAQTARRAAPAPPRPSPRAAQIDAANRALTRFIFETNKGKFARSVDIKKHHGIMTQLLILLSCCASPKKSNPDI